jgi:hypothetical protein
MRRTDNEADQAQPLAAQAEGGAVKLLRGPWTKDFLDEVGCSHSADAATRLTALPWHWPSSPGCSRGSRRVPSC